MKDDITGDHNFVFGGVPDAVGLTLFGIAHKYTRAAFRIQFSAGVLFSIDVGRAAENTKVR
jgi:hypothetical protein